MASRLTVFLEGAFGKHSRGKKRFAWALCILLGLTLASELGKAQSNTSHPPVISTSTQWTLDAPVLASSSASGVPSNGFSMQGAFSPDGTHLLFWSRSTNISPSDTSGLSQLYSKDLTTGAVSVVSADANGVEGNNESSVPNNSGQILMFSPDGTKVVFESAATNLVRRQRSPADFHQGFDDKRSHPRVRGRHRKPGKRQQHEFHVLARWHASRV